MLLTTSGRMASTDAKLVCADDSAWNCLMLAAFAYSLRCHYWFLCPASRFVFAARPLVANAWRFSLRTLLIATTLVAVVLGLIVWLNHLNSLRCVAAEVRNELRESASVFATCSPPTRATRPRPSPDDHKESRSKNAMGDGPRGGSPFLVGITKYQCPAMSKSSLIDGSLAL